MHIQTPMGVTAETLGAKYGVTREDCDQFALQSQTRWKAGKQKLQSVFELFYSSISKPILCGITTSFSEDTCCNVID